MGECAGRIEQPLGRQVDKRIENNDAPDCLAMLAEELYAGRGAVEVCRRPW